MRFMQKTQTYLFNLFIFKNYLAFLFVMDVPSLLLLWKCTHHSQTSKDKITKSCYTMQVATSLIWVTFAAVINYNRIIMIR